MRTRRLVGMMLGLAAILAPTLLGSAATAAGSRGTPIPSWFSLYGVAINADGQCYAVGAKATLLVSADKGKSWTTRLLEERPGGALFQDFDLYDIKFAPNGRSGWIIGEKGLIFHTADGGAKWERQDSRVGVNLFRAAVVDSRHAYAVGDDGTLLRTDDGSTWAAQQINHVTYFDITFTDANSGWAVGEFSTILGSTDGGKTWQVRYGGNLSDFEAGPFLSVIFSDHDHGYVLGVNGDLLTTADSGKTWQKQKLPESKAMYAGAIAPGAGIWLGGEDGQLLNLNGAGQWKERRVVFNDLTDVAFAPGFGLAVGLNGTLLRTDDGGREWHRAR